MKKIYILLFGLLAFQGVRAQNRSRSSKPDTLLYYLDSFGNIVDERTQAKYFLLIMPHDSTSKKLYPILEFYPNGETKLRGYSSTDQYKSLVFEGQRIAYFENGHKKEIANYSSGVIRGATRYYPNGKIYAVDEYDSRYRHLLVECRDSTGNVLAQDGNGKWIKFDDKDDSFKKIVGQGTVKDSLEDGSWNVIGVTKDGPQDYKITYQKGVAISTTDAYGRAVEVEPVFTSVETQPVFNGKGTFGDFLAKNIDYPDVDRRNNVQGRVIITFIVEKDGSVSSANVARAPDETLGAEALRVVQMTKWIPARQLGRPVRSYFAVPINFSLGGSRY